ncbi:UNVERIFIED_CONTAM: hypothetical protein K2H54_061355 [Gekko kuhli]
MALRRWTLQLGTSAKEFLGRGQGIRFSSAISSSTPFEIELDSTENEIVAPDFTNRNPRNLEQLALARKERGWKTTWPKQEYWHRGNELFDPVQKFLYLEQRACQGTAYLAQHHCLEQMSSYTDFL